MNPVIVVNAFRRPDSLRRLLISLQQAAIPSGVNIVFSLEYDAHEDVVKQVEVFNWKHGEKVIINQQEKQGLIGHFLFCGGLTAQYGTIIYLEDDLFVGTDFYKYAQAVLSQYGNNESIAGFSLNKLWFNGYLHLSFHPVDDGNPCFFLQVPWYHGQVYTAKQWQHFRQWYDNYKGVDANLQIHPMFKDFKLADEWFPAKTQYLIETGKYYCFPRTTQCVNFGDAGTHFKNKTDFFQTELSLHFNNIAFKSFNDCIAVYDSFYEIIPSRLKAITPHLQSLDFEVDLNGTKTLSLVKSEYIITPVIPSSFLKSYAFEMRPQELNIMYDMPGNHFYLAKTADVKAGSDKNLFYKQFLYYNRFKLTKKQKLNLFFRK